MLKRYKIKDYDFALVIMLIAISIIGVLAIGSAKESVQDKQIMGLIMGVFLMIVISLFDYSFFLNFYWILYILNIALLLSVTFFGKEVGGAQRWINILGIQFQPSETAKIILILFFAQFIMKHESTLNTFRTLAMIVLLLIPPLLLIYKQPDLSTSIMIGIIFCVLLFIGGLSYKIVIGVLAVLIPSFVIFLSIVLQPDQELIKDYQQTRILAWLQPANYANTEGYQQTNAITAIGSGQLFGKGLNNNIIGSVKNGNFISEPQTDFIFAIIGEELGFIGGCIVILLLVFITLKCIMIGKKAKDLSGTLICAGMAALVGFQSFINISVATGLLPNTGIPLPFVSYGLTSLVSLFLGMGFVLNVRLQNTKKY
ncbi:MAG: FtsW/RodA/SpoVE family cell cycle protein [Lachnospiraceae bacterium]|nr:FtsW/RodA/SpoVE family cell cycle protein [Lachnospiraceae bacterium]